MVSDGAKIVLGHICSGATKAALKIYVESKLVCMSPSATNTSLTNGEYPVFFRTIGRDDVQGPIIAKLVADMGKKKVAVLHDKGDYGMGFATFAKKALEKMGDIEIVLFEGVTPGAVDYTAVVQKVKRSGADAVVWGGYHPEASKIVMGMRKKRMDIPFFAPDGVKDDTFIKVAGKYAEGVYATGPQIVADNPVYKEAVAAHIETFGSEPGAFFPQAYAASQAMLNAIEKSGSTDYDKIVEALHTEYVETPLGKIKFGKSGDAEGVGFSVYQVKEGKFIIVANYAVDADGKIVKVD